MNAINNVVKHNRFITGDVDCVYHFALYELLNAVRDYSWAGRKDIFETIMNLINGKRLKDISDFPFDMSI